MKAKPGSHDLGLQTASCRASRRALWPRSGPLVKVGGIFLVVYGISPHLRGLVPPSLRRLVSATLGRFRPYPVNAAVWSPRPDSVTERVLERLSKRWAETPPMLIGIDVRLRSSEFWADLIVRNDGPAGTFRAQVREVTGADEVPGPWLVAWESDTTERHLARGESSSLRLAEFDWEGRDSLLRGHADYDAYPFLFPSPAGDKGSFGHLGARDADDFAGHPITVVVRFLRLTPTEGFQDMDVPLVFGEETDEAVWPPDGGAGS